jgi:hypothetical protein
MVLLLHGPHQLPTSSPFSMVRLINSWLTFLQFHH